MNLVKLLSLKTVQIATIQIMINQLRRPMLIIRVLVKEPHQYTPK